MCEYCENNNDNKKLIDTYLGKQKIEVNIDKAFDNYILISTINDMYSTCARINYCPNCGRKLNINKRKLINKNVIITLNPDGYEHNFRCGCGCNVFSEYIEDNVKKIFVCHSCDAEYTYE